MTACCMLREVLIAGKVIVSAYSKEFQRSNDFTGFGALG